MKLLIDANLSWRLVKLIQSDFPGSIHVEKSGLAIPAPDTEIWNYAKQNDFMIVSNDEDFLNLTLSRGFPPQIILLRFFNERTRNIAGALVKHHEEIELFSKQQEQGIFEIYNRN